MDHVDNKRMRKRLAFDIHHRRAPPVASLIAPGVTPGTDLETGSPSTARVPTTAPVAPTSPFSFLLWVNVSSHLFGF